MANKIKFKIQTSGFQNLITKLSDLTKISDVIKMKIDSENILLYSMLSSGQTMLAFKSYLINTIDFIDYGDFEYPIDIIIPEAKKFVRNLNFLKDSEKISIEFTYKESPDDDTLMIARSIHLSGNKLKINWISGEHYDVRDINKNALKQRLDLKHRKWSFEIGKSDFSDIKKLSNINKDRVIMININNGKVIFSEKASWELEVDLLEDDRNANLMLNKKFLSCINGDNDKIEFNIFENFMLIKDEESNLMLSFEQDFSDQD
jgi:hypothetical protein